VRGGFVVALLCAAPLSIAQAQEVPDAGVSEGAPAEGSAAPADAGTGQAAPPTAAAEAPPAEPEIDLGELEKLSLEELLEVKVVTGKVAQRAAEVPAVITVIKAEEIQARGYQSLADVLREVPGFYDVSDLTWHDVGIRGINVGPRSAGSLLKLMIDGEPVPYIPSDSNLFGPELVPIEAVDHIEIIRGPQSALYGANAFLGVINVITRSGKSVGGAQLTARGSLIRTNGGGGGGTVMVGHGDDNLDALVAVSGDWVDRSGLSLPSTSPLLSSHPEQASTQTAQDISRPKSAIAHVTANHVLGGRVTAWASIQNLDSANELNDLAPMSHGNHVGRLDQRYRLSYDVEPADSINIHLSGSYFDTGTTGDERIDLGRPNRIYLPHQHASGFSLVGEGTFRPVSWLQLTGGADLLVEQQQLLSYDTLYTHDVKRDDGSVQFASGTLVPGAGSGATANFTNVGLYLQGIVHPTEAFGITGGARVDVHNIYGVQVSPRIGLVFAPREKPLNLKLLFGTSFKAPSADQLYAQSVTTFDIQGNPKLQPQNAQTLELAAGWRFGDKGEVQGDLYLNHINGLVAYLQSGTVLLAQNLSDAWVAGGELEGRYRVLKPLWVKLGLGVAQTVVSQSQRDTLINGRALDQPFYPSLQVHATLDWKLPLLGLQLSPTVTVVSSRLASVFNALESFNVYSLPPYALVSATLSMPDRIFFRDRPTRFALRVDDILDARPVTPGIGGVDYPSLGRTFMFTVTQGF
jgi:iron complex outermembrane receptor protein